MDEIDYANLIKIVEKSVKASYETHERNGQQVPNVANLGAKAGDIAKLERSGEYYGISVEILENIKPLLLDTFVIRLLSMLKKEDYITPLELLGLTNIDQLQYILHNWFHIACIEYDNSIPKSKKNYLNFDDWINTVSSDPLDAKIKVVDVGYNQTTGNSVVPIEWIGRVFNDAYEMHKAMDKLETRLGKSPVTYAVIYSMIIQKLDGMIDNISNIKYKTLINLNLTGSKLRSEFNGKPVKGYSYVKYGDLLIGFNLKDILEPKGKIEGEHTQSVLREVGLDLYLFAYQ